MLRGPTVFRSSSSASKVRLHHVNLHPVAADIEQHQLVIESDCDHSLTVDARRHPQYMRHRLTEVQPVRVPAKERLPRYQCEFDFGRLEMTAMCPGIQVVVQLELEPIRLNVRYRA